MAALWNRAGHYISVLWFLLFFLAYSQLLQLQTGCLPYFYTWCGLSANLECRSEMCCTRLAENTGRKKWRKLRHLHTITQLCQAVSPQLRYVLTTGKNLLSSNSSSTCPHNMANIRLLTADTGLPVWVSPVGFVTAPTSLNGRQPNFARCLAVSWAGIQCIHFLGLLQPPNGILPGAKFTLRPSLAFSYIGSVTARHSNSGRAKLCGVQQRAPPIYGRTAITLGIDPHSNYFCC